MAGDKRAYHVLDGLRGVAALLIVTRHVPVMFGDVEFPHSYLAVDLFFVLSGFVLGHAYDGKLARGGYVPTFVALRLLRIYPLYLAALAAGTLYLWRLIGSGAAPQWNYPLLWKALAANALLLPAPADSPSGIFPIVGPAWTLALELVANLVFAVCHRWLTTRVLIAVVVVAGAAYLAAIVAHGSAEFGHQRELLAWGYVRVAFGFTAGVLLYRLGAPAPTSRPALAWAALGVLAICLTLPVPDAVSATYDIAMTLLLFPLLVGWGAQVEPGAAGVRVMAFLGLLSYAVYVLHDPIGRLSTVAGPAWFKTDFGQYAPWSGLVFIGFLTAVCWLADRYYDTPVRRWLRRRIESRATASPAKNTSSPSTR